MTEDLGSQIIEMTSVHEGLTNVVEHDAKTLVSGALPFEASHDGLETITGSFAIELNIPNNFSRVLTEG